MYEWYASLGSVFWNLVVDCPLASFCNQQGHIGTNVKCLCGVTIPTHIMLSVALSRAELWIILVSYQSSWSFVLKNKQTDHASNIMSKRHGFFTKDLTIFFSNAGET